MLRYKHLTGSGLPGIFMAGQKRHFVSTVHAGHLKLPDDTVEERFIEAMEEYVGAMGSDPDLRYLCGQVEKCPESGRLHGQLYSEWKKSFRNKELASRWPAHYSFLKQKCENRTGGRDYCTSATWDGKDKGQVKVLPAFGEWRPEKKVQVDPRTLKVKAIHYLIEEGLSPQEIAFRDPEVYFAHGAKIVHLYNALQGRT